MRFAQKLFLKFQNAKMEQEYALTKEKNLLRDFEVTVLFLIILNLIVAIPAIIHEFYVDCAISFSLIGFLILLFLVRKHFTNYIQHLMLATIAVYNITRLILLNNSYDRAGKTDMFYSGYSLASLQIIMVTRILKIQYRIFAMGLALALRFGLLLGVIDTSAAFPIPTFIRHFLIDCFIIFVFYSNEKAERLVFQNFYENREELMKFKELLADSLPLSITVVEPDTNKSLFSNRTFSSTFEPALLEPDTPYSPNKMIMTTGDGQNDFIRPQMELLMVDKDSMRKLGTLEPPSTLGYRSTMSTMSTYLKDIVQELIQDPKCDSPVSLTASYSSHSSQDQRRSYEVILKKVKWDRTDAAAIIINDITYQENLIALKMANVNKDKVIAIVSHELRTPLNGILGLIGMAEDKVTDPEVSEYLSLSKDNANLLLSLVNSILDLQQVAAGKLKLNPARFDIRRAFDGVVKLFQFQSKQKGIYIEANVSKDVPFSITSDENRLKQILINLIGNAIKFTFQGGIKIEVTQNQDDPDGLLIAVKDTGMGIKPEDKGKLFKMYGKLEDNSGVNKNGVGLGLTISNVLAAALNGSIDGKGIEVESEFGKGSTFYFEIKKNLLRVEPETKESLRSASQKDAIIKTSPLSVNKGKIMNTDEWNEEENMGNENYEELVMPVEVQLKLASYASLKKISTRNLRCYNGVHKDSISEESPDEEGLGTLESKEKLPGFVALETQRANSNEYSSQRLLTRNSFVLIVDDNPFNLLVAENHIKDSGYMSRTALSGQDAIEIIRNASRQGQVVKAILLDCQMPVMDGYETARTLKSMMEKKEIPTVPILGWTAGNTEEDIKKCFESGMVDYLSKPVSQSTLLRALSKFE